MILLYFLLFSELRKFNLADDGVFGSAGDIVYPYTVPCANDPNQCKITVTSDGTKTEITSDAEIEFDLVYKVLAEGQMLADQWFLSYEVDRPTSSGAVQLLTVADVKSDSVSACFAPIQTKLRYNQIENTFVTLLHQKIGLLVYMMQS